MAGASTVAVGMATGTMMAGAIVVSADAAGIVKVFEAAVLTTKVLDAAASMAVVNFVGTADSAEAEDFMTEATEVVMVGIAKGGPLSNESCLERGCGTAGERNCQPFSFLDWRVSNGRSHLT